MNRFRSLVFLGVVSVCVGAQGETSQWLTWRGPTRDNHVPEADAALIPTTWSESENVLWRSPVPGKGHATPIVVGNGIFVLTHRADQRTVSLLRFNLDDGAPSGEVVLHRGVVPPNYLHKKNTCASCTPSSDGKGIFIVAQVNDAIIASAVGLTGKIVWQQQVAPYRAGRGWFGYGASPLLLPDSLVVAVDTDNNERGLFALDRQTGRQRWRAPRPVSTSYSSPILATVDGQDQILISGGYQVASYDPATGRQLWTVEATSRTTCATMVWNDSMVFASGSYPDPGTYGISVSNRGARVAWENRVKCYEQSMLVVDGYLYGVADNGVMYCWRCEDGREMWKQRLGGKYSASPLLVKGNIFCSDEGGRTSIFRADPNGFASVAENRLGNSSFASPIVADGKLILRHATGDGPSRQEFLAAISTK
ncbi:MAG: PQQ-binding-like beta-propeller repeat protein [Planctomycetota bacterium]